MQNLASIKKLFSLANTLYGGKPLASFYSGKYGTQFPSETPVDNQRKPFDKLIVYNTQPYVGSDPKPDEDEFIMDKFKSHVNAQFAAVHKAWQHNPASGNAKDVLIKIVGSEFQFNGVLWGNMEGPDWIEFLVNTFVFDQHQSEELLKHYRENVKKLEAATGATVVAYYNTTEWSMTPDGKVATKQHLSMSSDREGMCDPIWGTWKGLLNVSTCVGSGWDGRAYKPMESSIDGFPNAKGVYPERFAVTLQEMKINSGKCEMKLLLRTCLEATEFVEGKDHLFEVILGSGTPDLIDKADIGTKFVIIGESLGANKRVDGIWIHKDAVSKLQEFQHLLSPENRFEFVKSDPGTAGDFQKLKSKMFTDDNETTVRETTLDLSFLKDPASFGSVFVGLGAGLQPDAVKKSGETGPPTDPNIDHKDEPSKGGEHPDPHSHNNKDHH